MTKIFKSISIFVRIDEYFRNQLIDWLEKIFEIVNARGYVNVDVNLDADWVVCVYWNCFKIMISAGVLWTAFIYLLRYYVFSTTTASSPSSFLLALLGFGVFVAHRFGIWTKLILACYSFKTAERSCQHVQKSERGEVERNMQMESERI